MKDDHHSRTVFTLVDILLGLGLCLLTRSCIPFEAPHSREVLAHSKFCNPREIATSRKALMAIRLYEDG